MVLNARPDWRLQPALTIPGCHDDGHRSRLTEETAIVIGGWKFTPWRTR